VGTQSDIHDRRNRTEPDIRTSDIRLKSTESKIISDIGINVYPISNIRNYCGKEHRSSVVSCSPWAGRGVGPNPVHNAVHIFTS
jgi:hypothetical protein